MYPRQWVKEEQVVIPKSIPLEGLESLRSLSKTVLASKVYEAFLGDWLMPIVGPFLDKANYGGMKGNSSIYYLIDVLHFIHSHVNDTSSNYAVLLAQCDLKRAFNSISHRDIIIDLYDMCTPGWILRILTSYLTDRNMTLRFRGSVSSQFLLPGSCPTGVFLSVLLFTVVFNGAFLRPRVPRGFLRCRNCEKHSYSVCLHVREEYFTAKFLDDSSQLRAINLRTDLIKNVNLVLPARFHERTGHSLNPAKNGLQSDLDEFQRFTSSKNLEINPKKSSVMLFNFSSALDFQPSIEIGGQQLKIVEQTTILGLTVSASLKWTEHVDTITTKARKRIYILRKMMNNGFDYEIILDIYMKEI